MILEMKIIYTCCRKLKQRYISSYKKGVEIGFELATPL